MKADILDSKPLHLAPEETETSRLLVRQRNHRLEHQSIGQLLEPFLREPRARMIAQRSAIPDAFDLLIGTAHRPVALICQVALQAAEHDPHVRNKVLDLWIPLARDVLQSNGTT
eukprot:CAMPEP_0177679676 /NCGR_PEP_ID=MMETSP0447-20121125/29735_1 /TAXON_ID=0 /ORGANISM="Stygamoeba regulata, Strain BSH-02190019" /LENGTH=113 /DNA_ID=CAMNT_0019188893 /DNA_START=898 /DNA_END=1239 /DNA_ORIENTATION=+